MAEDFVPHEYQKYCIEKIKKDSRLCLMLDMGLGKTVITLTALDTLISEGKISRALIIAPKRVVETVWSQEAQKWNHLKHLRINIASGSASNRLEAIRQPSDVVVISRDNTAWLIEELRVRKCQPFDVLVIDELTSFKNHKSQRYKAIKKAIKSFGRVYGLTGTPVANGFRELFAQMYLIDLGASLGTSLTAYTDEYFIRRQINASGVCVYEPKTGISAQIKKKIEPYCVSMKAKDYITLPTKIVNGIRVGLSEKEQSVYRTLARESCITDISGESAIDAPTAAVLSNKLLQLASGAVYDEDGKTQYFHDKKIKAFEDVVESMNGAPLLVFYNYRHELERMIDVLPHECRYAVLKSVREADAWNCGGLDILFAHPASCAYGLNLQEGGHIILWFSPCWSLELYLQANARLYRQGQKYPVLVHHLISEGTIDERVMRVLHDKNASQEKFLNCLRAEVENLYK